MRCNPRFTLTDILSLAAIVMLVLTCYAAAMRTAPKPGPCGLWLTQAGDAKVHVARCGEAVCGTVVWLREPNDSATGQPQRDDKNPDPSLRQRPIIGLQLFTGMNSTASNAWSGQIYNADSGQSYASTITRLDPERLEVRVCVGILCGKEIWTRIPS